MNAFWSYFWPVFAAGIAIGIMAGAIAFRRVRPAPEDELAGPAPKTRRRRLIVLGAGVAAAIAATAVWSGPLGAADHFISRVERDARAALNHYEMTKVTAHLRRWPLTRRLVLAGPADAFQTAELARLMSQLPGVSRAQWTPSPVGPPLLLEGSAVSVLGFLFGLLLAYLVELHRRYNAQWKW